MNDESIFAEALEIDHETERATFIKNACQQDAKRIQRIEALVAAHQSAPEFMHEPAAEIPLDGQIETANSLPVPADQPGDLVGPYLLDKKLGEGGMGAVFLATQTSPVKRKVALKIIRPGLETPQIVMRFQIESQALAIMDHPFIAKVFDVGVTELGRPYFVMEPIEGTSITDYCRQNNLTLEQRIVLVCKVCDAVQHAHQKGVIHRDLKPSNILVTEIDATATPKVVDFGVAKAVSAEIRPSETVTHYGQIMGTPQYMSPEQAELSPDRVDTRTDVYSLGIVVYELLTGTTPLEANQQPGASISEIFRRIRETFPITPSKLIDTKLGRDWARIKPAQLRGELDWIVMKALEKDPNRRYQTPSDLANDLTRYLNGLPVVAGPPSLLYRARKLARRHKVSISVASFVFLVVIAASIISIHQAIVAKEALRQLAKEADRAGKAETLALRRLGEVTRQKEAAQSARHKAEVMKGYVTQAFMSPAPTRDGKSVTVLEVLQRAVEKIDQDFADDLPARGEMLYTFGTTFGGLSQWDEAIDLFQRSYDLRKQILPENHIDTIRAQLRLGHSVAAVGRVREGQALLEQALELLEQHHAGERDDVITATTLLVSCEITEGDLDTAKSRATAVLNESKSLYGPESYKTAVAENSLAEVCFHLSEYERAQRLWEHVAEINRREFGEDGAYTISMLNNLAASYLGTQQVKRGIELMEKLLPIKKERFGPRNPTTTNAMRNLAAAYALNREFDKSITLSLETIEIIEEERGPNHVQTRSSLLNLGHTYILAGAPKKAIPYLIDCVNRTTEALQRDHPTVGKALSLLAQCHLHLKDYDKASQYGREALQIRSLEDNLVEYREAVFLLAKIYRDGKRYQEALESYRRCLDLWEKHFDSKHPRAVATRQQYSLVLYRTQNYQEATKQLSAVVQCQREGINGARLHLNLQSLSVFCLASEDYDKAITTATEALAIIEQHLNPNAEPILRQKAVFLWGSIRTGKGKAQLESASDAYAAAVKQLGWTATTTQTIADGFVEILNELRDHEQARQIAEQLYHAKLLTYGALDDRTWGTMLRLAEAHTGQKSYAEAEELLDGVKSGLEKRNLKTSVHDGWDLREQLLNRRIQLLLAKGDAAQAAQAELALKTYLDGRDR